MFAVGKVLVTMPALRRNANMGMVLDAVQFALDELDRARYYNVPPFQGL